MNLVLRKTFGGLETPYFLRHLFFGILIGSLPVYVFLQDFQQIDIELAIIPLLNTFLYPYSRFIYETIVDFIVGDNSFFVDGFWFLIAKLFTMVLCWSSAILIAPIGLIYLYIYHTRAMKS